MLHLLLRILKNGLPTALVLAALGYVLAEGAAMWVASQPTPTRHLEPGLSVSLVAPPADVGQQLRNRLPFTLAAWGFGLVLVFELLLHLWRGGKPPEPPLAKKRVEDETERLLNELLVRAEAERQAAACQASAPADNTGTPV